MTKQLSRRSLLGLDDPTPEDALSRFYRERSGARGGEGPRPRIPEELHGPVETSPVGIGPEPETTEPADLPLPDLQDEEIDEATVRQLAFDIERSATLLDVRFKGGPMAHAIRATPSLDGAITALLERRVAAVQLRYRHQGRQWWDTLLRTERGVRIVRIEQPFA